MLEELRLSGLGAIEAAVLDLAPGFTVITGETGAGKTMLLTGLGLLFGGRSDAGLVRVGHERAEVDGRLAVDPESPAARRVLEAGGSVGDDGLLLSRTVSAEGRSRGYAGGRAVPAALLTELGEELVAVHGQADQRGLLRPSVQRDTLDRFAGAALADALRDYRVDFTELARLRRELHEVTARRRERAQEADALRLGLAEIEKVDPQPAEDVALRTEVTRLGQVDLLRRSAEAAHAALSSPATDSDTDAMSLVAAARRAVEEARASDPVLDALAARLADVSYQLADVAADLASYTAAVEADPQRLELAQQRLADLTALTRKYAPDIDGVRAWADRASNRLLELDDDGRAERLAAEHEEVSGRLAASALRVSQLRAAAARVLETGVAAELAGLAMPHARLTVDVTQRPDEHGLALADGRRVAFGSAGVDEVELLLVAHPDAPPRPLHKGASGGELSRIMLALEVVLAAVDPVPTMVFDEVDAGVGGRAATEIGRRLAELARSRQVVVVTHLPQVAAFADTHLVVRKDSSGSGATTVVRRVEREERLEELARMLGGLPDSAMGRGHAEELLSVAAAAKSG